MKETCIRTDTLLLRRHRLTIYRVIEPDSATTLWTSEQQAVNYVRRLNHRHLLVEKQSS